MFESRTKTMRRCGAPVSTERDEWMAKARRAKRRKRVFMVRVADTADDPKISVLIKLD
jgi:hypothetical protein